MLTSHPFNRIANNFSLAWQLYWQTFRAPHQRLLRWVQGILLVFIVTLSLSSNTVQDYLQENLDGLLGADAVLSQKGKLSAEQLTELAELTESFIVTQQINTTLTHQGKWQQAQLKAVGSEYPLQGELLTSTSLSGVGEKTISGPKTGHIWLDARLMASLSIEIGQQILISDKAFEVSRVLQHEPDRLMEGHSVAMRAMINSSELSTLAFPTDLIHYRYLVAADRQQVEQLNTWQQSELPASELLHKQGRHPLALFWQRTENFLGLASIILFFMSAIAIEQLAQVHTKREQYFSAVCMSLGASKWTGIQVSLFKWLLGILVLLPIVLLLSVIGHYLIVDFLKGTFEDLVWQFNGIDMIKPLLATVAVFAVFHAPVFMALMNSSVAKLIRGSDGKVAAWLTKLSSIVVLICVAFAYSDNGLLTLMVLTSIALTVLLMLFISWLSLTFGEKVTQQVSGLFPFALFMMKQRLLAKSTQILGVGLCTFLLLFTLMLLKDLGATMSSYQRQHDGNVFVSQASEPQMAHIQDWAIENEIKIRQIKPYMHAKLIEINGLSLKQFSDQPSESLATMSKSIRMHWTDKIPENNRLASGSWWQEQPSNWQQVSVEQEVMTDLGLKLGDKLTFFIHQQSYVFEIKASHEFKPGAGSITFWVQMPVTALNGITAPHYNMASLELDEEQWSLIAPLWQKYPSLRMVSLKELTQLFDQTLTMVTKVISGFALMIVLLASVVILASINALESKEKKKNSIILSFGFTTATCLQLNVIEWLVTATITAVGAIAGTYIAGLLIYQSQFSLTYKPDFIWLFFTLATILIIMTGLGVYASRNSLRSSVKTLLAGN